LRKTAAVPAAPLTPIQEGFGHPFGGFPRRSEELW